jgi:hypothetical protein
MGGRWVGGKEGKREGEKSEKEGKAMVSLVPSFPLSLLPSFPAYRPSFK